MDVFVYDGLGKRLQVKTKSATSKPEKKRPTGSTSSSNTGTSKSNQNPKDGNSKQKKRGRTDNKSPSDTTNKPPSKKQNTGMSEVNTGEGSKATTNADLLALEKRLFVGFAQLIDPLKKDIEDLKKNNNGCVNCDDSTSVKIDKKFQRNEEKQCKIEDRLNLIEDQLLENNIIFQGIRETEYDDRDDVKIQVIKTLANIMEGETDEEKRTKAGQMSIEFV